MPTDSFANVALLGLAWTALVACSDQELPSPVEPQPKPALAFRPCNITTSRGTLANGAECAALEVPARRDVPNGTNVTLALKRYKTAAKARAQLWLVAGGPGAAASDFEFDAEFYAALGDELELYFLDHRGTGRSDRLSCPKEEASAGPFGESIRGAEWASCATTLIDQWGPDLSGFNPTEAAKDLGEAIERTRQTQVPVFIYAVSYGTYLAQRYLQIHPAQASGIVLDSICAPGRCDLLLAFDRQFDETARSIFETCAADVACSAELGTQPWSRVKALSTALELGACPALGWSKDTLRQILGMMTSIAGLRDYMPAVVRRAERCTSNDVLALANFRRFMSAIDTESSSFSQGLAANVILSELAPRPLPTADAINANVTGLFASMDAGPRLAGAIDAWPAPERDEYFGEFAETSVPLLMLNGTLDPQTPLAVAQPVGDFYRSAHQQFVTIPYSPHTTLTQSLVDVSGHTCGAQLVAQFLAQPTGALNLDCVTRVLPLDFAGQPAITRQLFGTDSAFADEAPAAVASDGTAGDAAAKLLLRRTPRFPAR